MKAWEWRVRFATSYRNVKLCLLIDSIDAYLEGYRKLGLSFVLHEINDYMRTFT